MLTVEFILPEHWAPTLINNDSTGNTPGDTATIHQWLAAHPGIGSALCCSEEPFFTGFHDVDGPACFCLIYTFPAKG